MLDVVTIGDKVDIREIDSDNKEKRECYASQVIDIINSTELKITVPALGTKLIPLPKGKRYECTFYTQKGLMRSVFLVEDRMKEGTIPVIILQIQAPLKKEQRREFFRYDCTLPIKFRLAQKDETINKEDINQLDWKDAVALDLSGGGIRFVTKESVLKNSYIQIRMILTIRQSYKEFLLYANVVSSKLNPNNVRLHECRIQFDEMTEAEQDSIISFIFEEQRKKRNMN